MSPKEVNGQKKIAPAGRPIYATNEKELQKKIKNRQSALESRRKNKERFEKLGGHNIMFLIYRHPKLHKYYNTAKFTILVQFVKKKK